MLGVSWVVLLKIIFIDIILSGDNAVVIALASRNLPKDQQKKAVFWGGFGAVALRIVLTFVAVFLLKIPFVNAIGGVMLVWIAIKLLKGEEEGNDIKSGNSLWQAIKTIIVADFVMSLDNVVAIAGTAEGHLGLIIFGLIVSIPIIIWGSQLLMRLMNRFPIIVTLGSALLGYTAGEMMIHDKIVGTFITDHIPYGRYVVPAILVVIVVVVGKILAKKNEEKEIKVPGSVA
ncbi:TerC family protein [Paenibacillus sp. WST5]|uniref:TerC family protein n=1 Tax=Paenibacillus sedimenti TaxID=2770274 RepID=A0A926QLH3_9BACL|nr:TerC family protein [Paenibacillus sedimenti]